MATRSLSPEVFERHLDLSPLHGRRRGLVRCIFQPRDRTPSLSVDLDALVFHCFGCGVEGGIAKFAELVGERQPKRLEIESPIFAARADVLDRARAMAPWWDLYEISDFVRETTRALDAIRSRAGAAEDLETLAKCAAIESEVLALEADVHERLGIRW